MEKISSQNKTGQTAPGSRLGQHARGLGRQDAPVDDVAELCGMRHGGGQHCQLDERRREVGVWLLGGFVVRATELETLEYSCQDESSERILSSPQARRIP